MANAMLQHDEMQKMNATTEWTSYASSIASDVTSNSTLTVPHSNHPPNPQGSCGIVGTPAASFRSPSAEEEDDGKRKSSIAQRKSVDFATLPPPTSKRMRSISGIPLSNAPKWTAAQVVEALAKSIVPKDRLDVIQQARITFQHDVEASHNEEMASGADAALTKHLTYLLYHYCHGSNILPQSDSGGQVSPGHTNFRLELSLTCDAMESLYRASSEVVALSFERLGPELCHLLVTLLNHELKLRQNFAELDCRQPNDHISTQITDPSENPPTPRLHEEERYSMFDPMDDENEVLTEEGDLLLRQATKILGHFARVGEATEPIAHYPGLLNSLILLISLRPYDLVPWEARLSALWILANLACDVQNMVMMASTSGLIQSLVNVAKRDIVSGDSLEIIMECLRSRSIASRAILNLSWAADNKVSLAENDSLIELLTELCILRMVPFEIGFARNSTTIQTILDKTRRHAIGALRNIAAAPRKIKIALCHYRNGHLLDVLTDAALNDPDTHVKDRALATIHNLAVYDTATIIVNHPALVLALKDVLLSSSHIVSEASSGDASGKGAQETGTMYPLGDGTPRQHASATLLVLERAITPEMSCYETLRDLLDALNNAPNSTTMEATAV